MTSYEHGQTVDGNKMASTPVYVFYVLFLVNAGVWSFFFDENETPKLRVYKDIEELLGSEKEVDLWTVGMYIAAHKYFGVDMRYQAGVVDKEDYLFYKQFPVPILRKIHKGLAAVCEQSAMDCVRELVTIARKSGSLQHLMRRGMNIETKDTPTIPLHAPFNSRYEDFRFRMTAMYYLCWHTLRRDKYLRFKNTRLSCLEYLNYVDEVPFRIRADIAGIAENMRNRIPNVVADVRDLSKYQKYKTDTCARLWFCPDPCYGRKGYGNFTNYNPATDTGNPCRDLPDPWCDWKLQGNSNFDDLIRNRFNITCNCESKWRGYEWNNKYSLCVDKDECYDNTHRCSFTRICRNSVGAYVCTCPRGFQLNETTSKCEKVGVIHGAAIILNVKEGLGATPVDDNDVIDDIMEIFGFSTSPCVAPSYAIALFSGLLAFMLVPSV